MLEDRKIKIVLKGIVWFFALTTIIPNIIPLYSSLPKIYNMEIDYLDDIQFTIYLLLGVIIPFLLIKKSDVFIDHIIYSFREKVDFSDSIKFIAIFISTISLFAIIKISFNNSYIYILRINKIFWFIVGLIIYLKREKLNYKLLGKFRIYEEYKKNNNENDEWNNINNKI